MTRSVESAKRAAIIPRDTLGFLAGGGEMGARMRAFDWSGTPLGPPEHWPQSLRSAVSMMLPSKAQIILFWGAEFTTLYNDGYRPVFGGKHPRVLGMPGREAWSEVWEGSGLRSLLEGVVSTGEAFSACDRLFIVKRFGYTEETYFDVSYDPVRVESGDVGGVYCIVTETTARVIGERRLKTLRDLGARTRELTQSVQSACDASVSVLTENKHDVPFALVYLLDADQKTATLCTSAGLDVASPAAPAHIDMSSPDERSWPLKAVLKTDRAVTLNDLEARFGELPGGVWPESTHTAVVLPIAKTGLEELAGFLVAGISPRRALDGPYKDFLELVAGHVATAIGNARAFEEERKRAEALAEIDRAKTAFFSNVSHEFRTPLTLMLGPVEEMLGKSDAELPGPDKEQLEIVRRNSLRLLKLVNTILDFSRIEAGRIDGKYEPVDLAVLTSDLASNFRSACEKAGLRLLVNCPPLPRDKTVYVDRDMWEKTVLNLLSNAFKFTHQGEIEVRLDAVDDHARLTVRDTGVGIPAEELPRMFERFHRIKSSHGRTHEGTGIGLALVQELVKLHGGAVSVESALGQGTTLTVTLPFGNAHLDPQHVQKGPKHAVAKAGAQPFVEEALRWLPDQHNNVAAQNIAPNQDAPRSGARRTTQMSGRARVLLADDNLDMRDYVTRLLAEGFDVVSVPDGQSALDAVRQSDEPPDLILTDVMMPRLDGFGLLRELRADPKLCEIPVIMLSARAGEESRLEGIKSGADDYLIKPFSAQELLTRVQMHAKASLARKQAIAQLRESEGLFRLFTSTTADVVYRMNADWTEMRHLEGREFIADTLEPSRTWLEKYIRPEDQRWVTDTIKQAIDSKSTFELEHPVIRVDGSVGWTSSRAIPILDSQGEIVEWFGAASDITERKRIEHALRDSEERYRNLFESMDEGYCIIEVIFDPPGSDKAVDYRFIEVNPAFEAQSGMHNVTGRRMLEFVPSIERHWLANYGKVALTGDPIRFANEYKTLNRWFDAYAFRVGRPDQHRVAVLFTDITERTLAEQALSRHAKQFETLVKQAPLGVYMVDADFRIRAVNAIAQPVFAAIEGGVDGRDFSEIMHILLDDAYADEIVRIFRRTFETGEPFIAKERAKHRTDRGVTEYYEWRIDRVTLPDGRFGIVCYYRDISEHVAIREELKQHRDNLQKLVEQRTSQLAETHNRMRITDRMAAVGTLAAGLAHDMTNLLMPLSARLDTLLANKRIDPEFHDELVVISTLMDHLRDLSRNLALFSRDPDKEGIKGSTDIAQWCSAVHKLLDASVGREIVINWSCPEGLPEAAIAPHRLTQAVQNLVHNARDAVLAAKAVDARRLPRIIVEARPSADETSIALRVADNGIGMDEETLQRCIEPFFTTRDRPTSGAPGVGGSGLGLSLAHQIVERCGGSMEIESEPGKGTAITITLPVATSNST